MRSDQLEKLKSLKFQSLHKRKHHPEGHLQFKEVLHLFQSLQSNISIGLISHLQKGHLWIVLLLTHQQLYSRINHLCTTKKIVDQLSIRRKTMDQLDHQLSLLLSLVPTLDDLFQQTEMRLLRHPSPTNSTLK